MTVHPVAIIRNVIVQQRPQALHVVAPIAMQFAGHGKPGHQLHAGLRHAVPGGITGDLVEDARGIGNYEDVVTGFDGGQCRERHAYLGDHARNEQLLSAGRLDGVDKILIVSGIDLAWAGDVWRIRELLLQLWHQRAVGAVLEAGGQDRRQREIRGDIRQRQHVILELVRINIANQ